MNQTTEHRPNRHLFFLIGCIVLILTALAHTVGHIQGPPPDMTDEQTNLLRLMQSVKIDIFGQTLTMHQIVEGYSLFFAASLAFLGVLGIALWKTRRADRALIRFVAAFYTLFLVGVTALSVMKFPLPPTIFLAVATVMFVLSLATA